MTAAVCPSDLALEAHLLDPERSRLAPHVGACDPCQARLAEMKRQGEDFLRFVYPATVDAVEAAATRAPKPWTRYLAVFVPAPVVAAAAAALLLAGPPDDYVGMKGTAGGVRLTVYAKGADGVGAPVADGGRVDAEAALKFRVRAGAPCDLYLLSVDPKGQVSRLFPDSGAAALAAGQHDLPGGAVLDGVAGPERVYAVCAPGGLGWDGVASAARKAAGGEAKVRGGRTLPLPEGTPQTSVLLEKVR
jgi:hypothetical protein